MSVSVLIATSFSIGFFFESIIGFGGSLIAYSILGFFMDLKGMILSGLYIGTCSSLYIAYGSFKSFDQKILKSVLPISIFGTIIGVLVFTKLSAEFLSPILGILLIFLAIKTTLFHDFLLPKIFRNKLIFLGGISHGAFGIGGPFVVSAIKNDFKNKSSLRATMAVFFIIFNVIRFIQLLLLGQIEVGFFLEIFWTIIPVLIAIKFGHKIHLKISEETFRKGVALMTILTGIKFIIFA